MGLNIFFKRKIKFDINNSSLTELLDNGILFEDTGKFLKWGSSVKDLSREIEVREKLFADRSVYNWGEHIILNGLSLQLTTTYWNHREDSVYKRLKALNYSVTGDTEAKEKFELIRVHLEDKFGHAQHKEMSDTEAIFEWIVSDTRLYLHYFEQYTGKLNFEISRL